MDTFKELKIRKSKGLGAILSRFQVVEVLRELKKLERNLKNYLKVRKQPKNNTIIICIYMKNW